MLQIKGVFCPCIMYDLHMFSVCLHVRMCVCKPEVNVGFLLRFLTFHLLECLTQPGVH